MIPAARTQALGLIQTECGTAAVRYKAPNGLRQPSKTRSAAGLCGSIAQTLRHKAAGVCHAHRDPVGGTARTLRADAAAGPWLSNKRGSGGAIPNGGLPEIRRAGSLPDRYELPRVWMPCSLAESRCGVCRHFKALRCFVYRGRRPPPCLPEVNSSHRAVRRAR